MVAVEQYAPRNAENGHQDAGGECLAGGEQEALEHVLLDDHARKGGDDVGTYRFLASAAAAVIASRLRATSCSPRHRARGLPPRADRSRSAPRSARTPRSTRFRSYAGAAARSPPSVSPCRADTSSPRCGRKVAPPR